MTNYALHMQITRCTPLASLVLITRVDEFISRSIVSVAVNYDNNIVSWSGYLRYIVDPYIDAASEAIYIKANIQAH